MGTNFEYQTRISHTPKTQVCFQSKFQDLHEHELNNNNLLTIKQCLEDGEGRLLGNNSSSDLKYFYNYPIFSQEFYIEHFFPECLFPSNFEDITSTLDDELTEIVSQFHDIYERCIFLQENIREENISHHTLKRSEQISNSPFVNQTSDKKLAEDQISSHKCPSFISYQSITWK